MNITKQFEKKEVRIDDTIFYIAPFSAFDSTMIFGDLTSVIGPILSSLVALFDVVDDEKGLAGTEISDAVPVIANAFSGIDGEKLGVLIKRLLIDKRKISFQFVDDTKVEYLDMDHFNELFCQDMLGVYQLCFEVIKLNYSSFFTKWSTRFGDLGGAVKGLIQKNMENSTQSNSASSN